MKKAIVIMSGFVWLCTLSIGLTNCFAYQQYDEKNDINSAYNKQQTNPSNYKKDLGYGLKKVE